MNLSGPVVAAAWKTFLKAQEGEDARRRARLVVLHDELEADLGQLKIRDGGSGGVGLKGHNGLKSILGAFGGRADFLWRVGVGIGPRPESRDSEIVARFVMRRMGKGEVGRVENGVRGLSRWLVGVREGE